SHARARAIGRCVRRRGLTPAFSANVRRYQTPRFRVGLRGGLATVLVFESSRQAHSRAEGIKRYLAAVDVPHRVATRGSVVVMYTGATPAALITPVQACVGR